MPYILLFEFMAPIIELVGTLMFIYLVFTGGVNWDTFWIVFLMLYVFAVMLSQFVVFYDYILGSSYTKARSYWKLVVAAMVEPFTYHPVITFCSLRGYLNYILGTKASWGAMTRKRYNTN